MDLSKDLESLTLSPPPIDLEELVEDSSGTRLDVNTYPDLGRVLVTTKGFEVGDLVFREAPVIVCKDFDDGFSKFKALPRKRREAIFDIHCRNKGVKNTKSKLREIYNMNVQSYEGTVKQKYTDVISEPVFESALFLWGSKIAHSCQPNLTYSSRTKDGKMEHRAIRPIKEGDVLTISYLQNYMMFSSIIRERQFFLDKQKKDFLCRCSRCVDFDYCRQHRCRVCSKTICCKDVRKSSKDDESLVWICLGCGPCHPSLEPFILRTESKFMMSLLNPRPEAIGKIIEDISKECSPSHAMALRAVRSKAEIFFSTAQNSRSKQPRLSTALTLLDLVNRTECCAAKCNGIDCRVGAANSSPLISHHPPVFEASTDIVLASKQLLLYDASGKLWPDALVTAIRRYFQFISIVLGADDEAVLKLVSIITPINLSKDLESLTLSQPLFDLEELVEDTSGTRLDVETYPDMGRVLVATKGFEVGDLVFREAPVIICKDFNDGFSKFKALPKKRRHAIFDMHCRNKGGKNTKSKLKEIFNTNAHGYEGTVKKKYDEIDGKPDFEGALFLWGSKIAHSCQPNLTCTSRTKDGKMEHKAIRPIKEGDVLTISYLENSLLHESFIGERQMALYHQNKDFLCRCSRCVDFDNCRQHHCRVCSKKICCKDVRRSYTDEESLVWNCLGCGPCHPSLEPIIMNRELKCTMSLMKAKLSNPRPEAIDKIIKDISDECSPSHAMALRAVRFKAHSILSTSQDSRSTQPRLRTALTLLDLVNRTECSAAKCNGIDCRIGAANDSSPLISPHPPVFEAATDVFRASKQLLLCDASGKSWPYALVIAIRRYLQFMSIELGADDEDVLKLVSIITPEDLK